MEKIQETIKFVEKQRSQVHFDLADTKAVLALENQLKQKGTPLSTYYASWKKIKDREMAVKIARKPQVSFVAQFMLLLTSGKLFLGSYFDYDSKIS